MDSSETRRSRGKVGNHDVKNFELKIVVMTTFNVALGALRHGQYYGGSISGRKINRSVRCMAKWLP
jgi:hypothetical protein